MTHALAEAAKNTKNAVEHKYEVLLYIVQMYFIHVMCDLYNM